MIMSQIVPDPVERYLAGLNHARDAVLDDVAREGEKQNLPLVDAEVGALLRVGGLLVTDNVLWDGEVVPGFVEPPQRDSSDTKAIAEYNERLNAHPQLITATVPLRDGVAISVKRG